MSPKISIITISYNSASTIERTIMSVLSQDYPDKEYIIVDGCSSDGTIDIINKYKDRIDVFISERDNGISDAFNKGISRATGDLIVLINSDDYLLPGILTHVATQWDGKSDILSYNYIAEREDCRYRIKPSLDFPTMPFFRRPVHQGRFISKALYDRIGLYDVNIRYCMDLDFLMRATKSHATFQYVDHDASVFSLGGATADSILKKKNDYIYTIRKNGGNILQAYIFYAFLVITQESKKIINITSKDIIRAVRYKKVFNK